MDVLVVSVMRAIIALMTEAKNTSEKSVMFYQTAAIFILDTVWTRNVTKITFLYINLFLVSIIDLFLRLNMKISFEVSRITRKNKLQSNCGLRLNRVVLSIDSALAC